MKNIYIFIITFREERCVKYIQFGNKFYKNKFMIKIDEELIS